MMRRLLPLAAATAAVLMAGACAFSPFQTAERPAPRDVPVVPADVTSPGPMVAAANPLAAEAGMAVLRRGGSAVDAAVAVQAMLSLVEPQSSGVGGGAFMLVYDARTRAVTAYDGRETAPAAATPELFIGPDGKPLGFREAVVSGRATGVPGAVAMLALAQSEHARLPWRDLFGEATVRAEEGFAISPRLARLMRAEAPQTKGADFLAYFSREDGTLKDVGDTLRNPAYAATLRRLAAEGPDALYEGPIAEAIVARTGEAPLPGGMTLEDLRTYHAKSASALCRPFRTWRVCAPPPPSSGVSLLQAIALLDHAPAVEAGAQSPAAWMAVLGAQRLMYADRDQYVADSAFTPVPVTGLLDPAYVAERARLIGDRAGAPPSAGTPPGAPARAADRTREPAGTSHFVIVDRWGNAVSMTTTVESLFGTGRMVGGFFLNNQLTDFSFSPRTADGAPVANAVAAGKRPRSSMSPLIVLDGVNDAFVGALGSPGGSAILGYNLKTFVGMFIWGLHPQAAIDLPNVIARGAGFSGEADKLSPELRAGLEARGVTVRPGAGEDSGLHAVILRDGRLEGGADRRREGVVLSD